MESTRNHFSLTSAIVLDVVRTWFGCGLNVARTWVGGGSDVFLDLVQTVWKKLRESGFQQSGAGL